MLDSWATQRGEPYVSWFARGRVPRWCDELSAEQWALGARCVQQVLGEYGDGRYVRWRRTGRIPLSYAYASGRRIDLHVGPLLYDTCLLDPGMWVKAIRRELAFQTERAPRMLRATTSEELLRPLLLPVPVPLDDTAGMVDILVRRWSDGVVTVLAARAPEGTRMVTGQEARNLDADPVTLWDSALHNLRSEPVRLNTVVAAGAELTFVSSDDRFGMGHLVRLGELIDGPAPHGVLVGILGSPDLFAFHRIVRRTWALGTLNALRDLSPDGHPLDNSVTGISGVHWWKEGLGDAVEVGTSADAEVPPRMAEVLDRLPD